jgi:aconitate hydratase
VVTEYLEKAGLQEDLDKLGFNLVGYGCTTCIGNSGPLPEEISKPSTTRTWCRLGAVGQPQLRGPVTPDVQGQLPGLAAAGGGLRAGRHGEHRPDHRPLGRTRTATVYLKDIWPTQGDPAEFS